MPTPLFKQISLWKQQEQTPTHPMSYKFLHDEESSSEKGSVQTLNNDDIRPSPRLHERILFGILIFVIIVLSGLLIDSHRRIQASPPPKPKSPVPDCMSKSKDWGGAALQASHQTRVKYTDILHYFLSPLKTRAFRLFPNLRIRSRVRRVVGSGHPGRRAYCDQASRTIQSEKGAPHHHSRRADLWRERHSSVSLSGK